MDKLNRTEAEKMRVTAKDISEILAQMPESARDAIYNVIVGAKLGIEAAKKADERTA